MSIRLIDRGVIHSQSYKILYCKIFLVSLFPHLYFSNKSKIHSLIAFSDTSLSGLDI